jgi:hypothetical protein
MAKSRNCNLISITGVLSFIWPNVIISYRRRGNHETPNSDKSERYSNQNPQNEKLELHLEYKSSKSQNYIGIRS